MVPRTGRILTIFSPAGMEQFFRDVSEADRAGTLGPQEMVSITEKHGAVWVDGSPKCGVVPDPAGGR